MVRCQLSGRGCCRCFARVFRTQLWNISIDTSSSWPSSATPNGRRLRTTTRKLRRTSTSCCAANYGDCSLVSVVNLEIFTTLNSSQRRLVRCSMKIQTYVHQSSTASRNSSRTFKATKKKKFSPSTRKTTSQGSSTFTQQSQQRRTRTKSVCRLLKSRNFTSQSHPRWSSTVSSSQQSLK